jgi:hypothetical protein
MNQQLLVENNETAVMTPCAVLCQLQTDLASLAKSKTLPFEETYRLTPDLFVEIHIEKDVESGNFKAQIRSINGTTTAEDLNFKKLLELTHQKITRAVSACLSRLDSKPCSMMPHLAVDEILALYKCISQFKVESKMPYSFLQTGPRGSYDLFSIRETNGRFEVSFETNYIHGNAMRWRAEVEYLNQAMDRADKVLADSLGEWLKQGVSAKFTASKNDR